MKLLDYYGSFTVFSSEVCASGQIFSTKELADEHTLAVLSSSGYKIPNPLPRSQIKVLDLNGDKYILTPLPDSKIDRISDLVRRSRRKAELLSSLTEDDKDILGL